ncbi:MAG: hypothetical protein JHC98_02025 [Thermoleophilaceae bacterium]|nr:hypothetical protein [Thermoleophilaceae bacterium]
MKCARGTLATLLAVTSLCAGAGSAAAAAGDLDPAFGSGGVARQSFGMMGDLIAGIALQADGRIVAGGSMYNDLTGEYGLGAARFTATGQLDGGYGSGGFTRLDVAGQNVFASSTVQQADGKLLVGGTGNTQVFLAQFGANGGLDPGYAGGFGYLSRDWGGTDALSSLSLLPSGAALASGTADGGFTMGSYTSAGVNNNIFNPGSTPDKTVQLSAFEDSSLASEVLPDGRFVLAGRANTGGFDYSYAVARFLPDGMPDPSFAGGTGFVLTPAPIENFGQINDIVLGSDNSIYAAGSAGTGEERDSVLLKYTPGGALDASFGSGGIANLGVAGEDGALALVFTPDGKLAVTGSTGSGTAHNVFVARTSLTGALDASFGAGGRAITDLGGDDEGVDLVVLPDLKIVVGGKSAVNGVQTHDFVLLQYMGTTAPAVIPVPVSKITSPSKRTLRAKSFKRIAGTAGPAGSIRRVEIAVRRIDAKALKSKRCVWLKSVNARFKKVKSTAKKKCTKQVWLKAKGTAKWSFSLKGRKRLPRGSYEIYSRVTLTDGTKQSKFTTRAGNFRKLKLN